MPVQASVSNIYHKAWRRSGFGTQLKYCIFPPVSYKRAPGHGKFALELPLYCLWKHIPPN